MMVSTLVVRLKPTIERNWPIPLGPDDWAGRPRWRSDWRAPWGYLLP